VLAHNKSPPMGANMIPTAKKRGRTVLGVRMGLKDCVNRFSPQFLRKYTLPCFQTLLSKRRIWDLLINVSGQDPSNCWRTWGSSGLGLLAIFSNFLLALQGVGRGHLLCLRHDSIDIVRAMKDVMNGARHSVSVFGCLFARNRGLVKIRPARDMLS